MALTSADLARFDVIIDGQGYLCADLEDVKGEFAYTPTFITRQNTQGDYGDNQQDFWLTATQRDWSLGEQQRYFRSSDDDSKRRYWDGQNVDVSRAGEVTMRPAITTATLGANAVCIASDPIGVSGASNQQVAIASSANLYTLEDTGIVSSGTSQGAHGLGATPSLWGICTDFANVYMSTGTAGTVGVRKWNGAAFSTFSANSADSLLYLNNTLYGLQSAGGFYRYDSAGTATSLFVFKDAAGASLAAGTTSKLFAFGGKVGILYDPSPYTLTGTGHASLWFYDGTGVSIAARFPGGFKPYDVCVAQGVVYVSGTVTYKAGRIPIIYYYANGSLGQLWKLEPPTYLTNASAPAMIPWESGLLFTAAHSAAGGSDSAATLGLNYYNAETGGSSNLIADWSVAATDPMAFGSTGTCAFAILPGSTAVSTFRDAGTTTSTAYLKTALIDFESSLPKRLHGIKVEFDSGTDGDGGAVQINYRVDNLDGSYTTLQTGAVSGTEYTLTNISGRSISVKVRLTKGTSTYGPKLKRISVRASPVQQSFAKRTLILKLEGRSDRDPEEGQMMQLRDNTRHTKDGATMASDLRTSATSTNPITIIDELGTVTALIDLDGFKLQRIRKGEYLAVVPYRQV